MFDFTQMRNYEDFLPEIYRVLRPGGMFFFSEFEYPQYESQNPSQLPLHSAPYTVAIALALLDSLEKQSVSIHGSTQMADWLVGLGGFSSITNQWCAIPSGPWHPDPLLQDVGKMVAQCITNAYHNLKPLLKSSGLSDEAIDKLVEEGLSDVRNPFLHLIFKYHVVCAFKA